MTMRKLLRRRSAIRELLQNLETRPFSEDTPPSAGGWLNQSRPASTVAPPCAPPGLAKAIVGEVAVVEGSRIGRLS